jgi:hypothetical protein
MWAGALALSVGLGMIIPAAQALWYDTDELAPVTVPRGQVGFAATRDDPVNTEPLKDSAGHANAERAAYLTRADQAGSVSVGTSLAGQLRGDDAAELAKPAPVFAKYVVDGLAEGNSRLTYTASVYAPTGALGVSVAAPVRLVRVPESYYTVENVANPDGLLCEDFFKDLDDPEGTLVVVTYSGNGVAATSGDLELVNYPQDVGVNVWCLMATPPSGSTYSNDASITGSTTVGDKSAEDSWIATVERSDDPDEQLIVAFTPTVSRWNEP